MDKEICERSPKSSTGDTYTARDGIRRKKQQARSSTKSMRHYNPRKALHSQLVRTKHDMVLLDTSPKHALLQNPTETSR